MTTQSVTVSHKDWVRLSQGGAVTLVLNDAFRIVAGPQVLIHGPKADHSYIDSTFSRMSNAGFNVVMHRYDEQGRMIAQLNDGSTMIVPEDLLLERYPESRIMTSFLARVYCTCQTSMGEARPELLEQAGLSVDPESFSSKLTRVLVGRQPFRIIEVKEIKPVARPEEAVIPPWVFFGEKYTPQPGI